MEESNGLFAAQTIEYFLVLIILFSPKFYSSFHGGKPTVGTLYGSSLQDLMSKYVVHQFEKRC